MHGGSKMTVLKKKVTRDELRKMIKDGEDISRIRISMSF